MRRRRRAEHTKGKIVYHLPAARAPAAAPSTDFLIGARPLDWALQPLCRLAPTLEELQRINLALAVAIDKAQGARKAGGPSVLTCPTCRYTWGEHSPGCPEA